jgi:hypothetical protein
MMQSHLPKVEPYAYLGAIGSTAGAAAHHATNI